MPDARFDHDAHPVGDVNILLGLEARVFHG